MYLYLTYQEAHFLSSVPLFPVGHAKPLNFGVASALMQRAGTGSLCQPLQFSSI